MLCTSPCSRHNDDGIVPKRGQKGRYPGKSQIDVKRMNWLFFSTYWSNEGDQVLVITVF